MGRLTGEPVGGPGGREKISGLPFSLLEGLTRHVETWRCVWGEHRLVVIAVCPPWRAGRLACQDPDGKAFPGSRGPAPQGPHRPCLGFVRLHGSGGWWGRGAHGGAHLERPAL